MGVKRGAACKLCRREGEKLFLKGEKCETAKCAFLKRSYAPGMHGLSRRKNSDYAIRLREKQRARRFYNLGEKQFRKFFEMANKSHGVTGTVFLQSLEKLLFNVVYRMGLADSRAQARQLIKHGHFLVNGKKVNVPSFRTNEGDIVTIKEKSMDRFNDSFEKIKNITLPGWVSFNPDTKEGKVLSTPEREEIDAPVSEQLIIEFYSK